MRKARGRVFFLEPVIKTGSQAALLRTQGGGIPFGAVPVIDRYERGLSTHREAHILAA